MPSMSAHMVIAFSLSNKLSVDKEEFIKGNILPDLYDIKTKSHYKIPGKKYLVPDIDKVTKLFDTSNSLYLGYITHLLLDRYFLEDYLIKYPQDVFEEGIIYKDYDILNKDVIEHFNIDQDYIKSIMNGFPNDINNRKLESNINCLYITKTGKLGLLNKKEFLEFLDKMTTQIEKDIKGIIRSNRDGKSQ